MPAVPVLGKLHLTTGQGGCSTIAKSPARLSDLIISQSGFDWEKELRQVEWMQNPKPALSWERTPRDEVKPC